MYSIPEPRILTELLASSSRPRRGKESGSVTSRPMLSELGWESLEARRMRRSLVSFYKLVNSCFEIPNEYHPRTKPPGPTPRANTRHFITWCQLRYSNSFIPRTIPSWNSLPETVIVASYAEVFQRRLASVQFYLNHPANLITCK